MIYDDSVVSAHPSGPVNVSTHCNFEVLGLSLTSSSFDMVPLPPGVCPTAPFWRVERPSEGVLTIDFVFGLFRFHKRP